MLSFAFLHQESAILDGKVRPPLGAGASREDGGKTPVPSMDGRLRDKQEKFEKLDRKAEIVSARLNVLRTQCSA